MPTSPLATTPAWTGRVTVNGARLAVRDRGGDEPVVLLHPGFVADGMAPLFAEPALGAYRLVAYQRRGYGRSDRTTGPVTVADQAGDLLALLEARGIGRAHLVGHSFGANVALEAALTAPERVATLALLEPLLGFAVAPATAQFVLDTAAESYRRLGEGDPAGAVDGWLTAAFDPGYREILEGALPGAFRQAVRDAEAPFAVEVPSLRGWPRGPEDLRRVTQPALSVRGADGTWPGFRETHQALCSWLPYGEGLLVPAATHLLQMANPRAVAEGLAGFLARHPR
jgi:pimeloyl-ACP methyl ester carboxylesterase